MFRTTRTGSGYKHHPRADSLYSFHIHLAFHHFLRSLVVPGVECLLLPSTRTSSLSMVTAEPVSTSILVGLVPTQPSTKTAASLAMLPAEWVAWGWRALLKGLWRGQSFRICPRSLQFQHTGPFLRALSAHGPFGDAHYQSTTGLVLRTNAVLVWKVLLAARCLGLLPSDGEHWPCLPGLQLQWVDVFSIIILPAGNVFGTLLV